MRVLVTTIVHHPEDARILHRQIAALVGRGHQVTYLAPFTATDTPPRDWFDPIDVPRALGRRRVKAVRAARALLRQHGPKHDLVLVHDLELLAATAGLRLPPVVWDVHEDTGASLTLKP
jgi:Glycosyltransferase Family 4